MKVIVTEIKHSNFVEEEHPRDKDGKFTVKNGGETSSETDNKEKSKKVEQNIKKLLEKFQDDWDEDAYDMHEKIINECVKSGASDASMKMYNASIRGEVGSDHYFVQTVNDFFNSMDTVANEIEPDFISNIQNIDSDLSNKFLRRIMPLPDEPPDEGTFFEWFSIDYFKEYVKRDQDPKFYDDTISMYESIGLKDDESILYRFIDLYKDRIINGKNSEWQKILDKYEIKHSDKSTDTHLKLKNSDDIDIGKAIIRDYGDGEIFLSDFEIKEEYRNKGLGTKWLNNFINDYGVNSLTVTVDNKVARHMYEKAGFEIIGDPYFDEKANSTVYYMKKLKHSNFVEEEHPRDKDGKFTTKNGSDINTQSEEVKRHHQRFKESSGGTYSKDDVVFVSGKVKYDKPLDNKIKDEVKRAVDANSKIIIGDAPGADTRVQDYLSELKYDNVEVYTTDETVRNNVGNWPVNKISGEGYTEEREVRRQKDIAMTNTSTKGIVVSSSDDRIDSATSLNVDRLIEQNKPIQFYDYKNDELYENVSKDDNNDVKKVETSSKQSNRLLNTENYKYNSELESKMIEKHNNENRAKDDPDYDDYMDNPVKKLEDLTEDDIGTFASELAYNIRLSSVMNNKDWEKYELNDLMYGPGYDVTLHISKQIYDEGNNKLIKTIEKFDSYAKSQGIDLYDMDYEHSLEDQGIDIDAYDKVLKYYRDEIAPEVKECFNGNISPDDYKQYLVDILNKCNLYENKIPYYEEYSDSIVEYFIWGAYRFRYIDEFGEFDYGNRYNGIVSEWALNPGTGVSLSNEIDAIYSDQDKLNEFVNSIIKELKNDSNKIKHSDFVEEEHPRDKDGKFASKNSSDASTDDVNSKISKSQKITMAILATTFGALTATAAIMLLNERNPITTRQAVEKYINGKWVKVGKWH